MATQTIDFITQNILEDGTVTVTGTPDTGFPESRLYDRAISLLWKDTVTEAKTFLVDYGSAVEIDTLYISGHNFSGEDMQWQYSTDNFAADTNDAVTDWTQSGNLAIVKSMGSSQTKRYWRVTVTSMTNPECAEILMGLAYSFDISHEPMPVHDEMANVRWYQAVGGLDRSIKRGEVKQHWQYIIRVDDTGLANFETVVGELDDLSKPFLVKDGEGDYYWMRFNSLPVYRHILDNWTEIDLDLIEVL